MEIKEIIERLTPDWFSDLGRRLIGFVNSYANDAASPPAAPSAHGDPGGVFLPSCSLLRHQSPTV